MGEVGVHKIIFAGKCGVGKTTLIQRIQNNTFVEKIDTTVGAAFACCHFPVSGDQGIRVHIWDVAGADRFAPIVPLYIRNSSVVILCFDFPDAAHILRKQREILSIENAEIYYVATKMDINSQIDFEEIEQIFGKIYYTSAKNGMGIQELINDIGKYLYYDCKHPCLIPNLIDLKKSNEHIKSSCCTLF
jgi:small GTP-binding protein